MDRINDFVDKLSSTPYLRGIIKPAIRVEPRLTGRELGKVRDLATTTERPAFIDGSSHGLFIAGRWESASDGAVRDSIDPATGRVIAYTAEATVDDVDRAVSVARSALTGPWGSFTPYERQRLILRIAQMLEERADEFALIESHDMGAPVTRVRLSIRRAVQNLHWYAANALSLHGQKIQNSAPGSFLSYTTREPIGVVAGIIPWNAPTTSSVWKVGPVLTTGCTIVLKPAEDASLPALLFAELCAKAGVPDGVVNVVTGAGDVVGARLAEHPGVDKIAFTGSRFTGGKVAEAAANSNLKRVSLELGGKSPNIVFADADMSWAVPGAAMAVFSNSGQVCSAGTRLFVESRIFDEFVERVAEFARGLRVGHPMDEATDLGPLVSARQLDRVLGYIEGGHRDGATALAGGARLAGEKYDEGFFVAPTVFADVRDDMPIAREEIFGPVIAALPFEDLDEVAARANETRFGLGSGIWTSDFGRAERLARLMQAGSVWVNCYQQMDSAMPFGGYKESGYGRESGTQQLDEYLNTKAVWVRTG